MAPSIPVPVALCSYDSATGWRTVGLSRSASDKVSIFAFGKIKVLKIPCTTLTKSGLFCNPTKIVSHYLAEKYSQ